MKVLVIGSGGREHALVWKLAQSPTVEELYCAPGNPGMAGEAVCVDIASNDIAGLKQFALDKGIGLTVVGPEAPLVDGLADEFEAAGLTVAGPSAYAAQLEGSKSFAKDAMTRFGVPTAGYKVFTDPAEAKAYVLGADRPLVVKADGLAAGKGVLLCKNAAEAEVAVESVMVAKDFGDAGDKCVVEEFLVGEEASFLVFSDGKSIVAMPSSQDHKAVGEGDTGPNTGGMGAYSPAPVVTPSIAAKAMDQVIKPMIQGMAAEGHPFKGILYAGLMIDGQGEMGVLEFNVRFGDPEAQPLLVRLESDLADILLKLAQGKLDQAEVVWSDKPSVCVVLASGGYPGKYPTGKPISGLENASLCGGVTVFHAGTKLDGGTLVTSGGRVLGVTALGASVAEAIERAYEAADLISWEDMYMRRDIGHRALARNGGGGPLVGVVMGSPNDQQVMAAAGEALSSLSVPHEMRVLSAHRTPAEAAAWAKGAAARGIKVLIAGAGWAAHLAGALAAQSDLPVIAVPIDSSPLNGMDALLASVQMPPGVPVATVAIGKGGAFNAGILAAQILALSDRDLAARLAARRGDMAAKVLAADQELSAG
ncbi:MAG: phosphoribosylamine--glycine ligase [Desulfarculaceae bacterium]|nr:phosphoribosylamine--glycine ligase [Desulfarculaceae bacterium]MCF8103827.1 phosphoribosylamine--glycine ligase [Desulfarculaceae bacterium]